MTLNDKLQSLLTQRDALNKEIETLNQMLASSASDKLFLLSAREYQESKERIPNLKCWWWLRDKGCNPESVVCVDSKGDVCYSGNNVFVDTIGVRPALRLGTTPHKTITNTVITALGTTWENLEDDVFIAENPIFFDRFDITQTDYKTSEIRQKLIEWYNARKDYLQ